MLKLLVILFLISITLSAHDNILNPDERCTTAGILRKYREIPIILPDSKGVTFDTADLSQTANFTSDLLNSVNDNFVTYENHQPAAANRTITKDREIFVKTGKLRDAGYLCNMGGGTIVQITSVKDLETMVNHMIQLGISLIPLDLVAKRGSIRQITGEYYSKMSTTLTNSLKDNITERFKLLALNTQGQIVTYPNTTSEIKVICEKPMDLFKKRKSTKSGIMKYIKKAKKAIPFAKSILTHLTSLPNSPSATQNEITGKIYKLIPSSTMLNLLSSAKSLADKDVFEDLRLSGVKRLLDTIQSLAKFKPDPISKTSKIPISDPSDLQRFLEIPQNKNITDLEFTPVVKTNDKNDFVVKFNVSFLTLSPNEKVTSYRFFPFHIDKEIITHHFVHTFKENSFVSDIPLEGVECFNDSCVLRKVGQLTYKHTKCADFILAKTGGDKNTCKRSPSDEVLGYRTNCHSGKSVVLSATEETEIDVNCQDRVSKRLKLSPGVTYLSSSCEFIYRGYPIILADPMGQNFQVPQIIPAIDTNLTKPPQFNDILLYVIASLISLGITILLYLFLRAQIRKLCNACLYFRTPATDYQGPQNTPFGSNANLHGTSHQNVTDIEQMPMTQPPSNPNFRPRSSAPPAGAQPQ